MKVIKSIVALVLCLAFLNVLVGRVIHELLEHDHVEHACCAEGNTHFCEFGLEHCDFICDFTLDSTDSFGVKYSLQTKLDIFQSKIHIKYLWLVKNLFYDLNLQRGPPSLI